VWKFLEAKSQINLDRKRAKLTYCKM